MQLGHEAMHELVNAAARLTAIVRLLGNEEASAELNPEKLDLDVQEALARFARAWDESKKESR